MQIKLDVSFTLSFLYVKHNAIGVDDRYCIDVNTCIFLLCFLKQYVLVDDMKLPVVVNDLTAMLALKVSSCKYYIADISLHMSIHLQFERNNRPI